MIKRRQIHKLIDQLPETAMDDIEAMLQDYVQYNTAVPRLNGIPVYEMNNPVHVKILTQQVTARPTLTLARKE